MDADLAELSRQVGERLMRSGWRLATAESCTGGWVAAVITATPGSSQWFDRGFVTYSNAAKQELLGVSEQTLNGLGAVSEATAREMAAGALRASHAQASLAITGIAGPLGGSADKPVGTVCFAWCLPGLAPSSATQHFAGDREAVRRAALVFGLTGLIARLPFAS
ncbi:MAG: nicotinamide-nucleotide amidase [Rhodocyclaceae bacterium]